MGEGDSRWGKNENEELGEKNEQGERKSEKNYIKNGGKVFEIAKLIRRGKKINLKKGGGGMIEMHNIYP